MSAPSVRTLLAQIEHEETAIAEASHRLNALTDRLQLVCTHPRIAEAPYREGRWLDHQPPFRVCLTCGYAEETWGSGPIELGPRGRDAIELTRDQARAHVRGKPGAFILSNAQAVERARRLGRHGWKPRIGE